MGERNVPYAKKGFGQNFLVSRDVAAAIVESLAPVAGDLVFEIGPGRGALTAFLAESGADIVAYEIDRPLARLLAEEFQGRSNVEIVQRDVREVDFEAEAAGRGRDSYLVIGNIPYNLTSVILIALAFLEGCRRCVCMVQREVGERVLAGPGVRRCGVLSVFLQSYLDIERVMRVRPGSFRPRPRVESVVLRFSPRVRAAGAATGAAEVPDGAADASDGAASAPRDRRGFLEFLKLAFSQRRKRLLGVLREAAARPEPGAKIAGAPFLLERLSGVDLRRRPEELTLPEWYSLFGGWIEMKGNR